MTIQKTGGRVARKATTADGKRQNAAKVSPRPTSDLIRFEEANVARLGLISVQERIPESYASWTVDFHVDGRPARLTCDAVAKYGGVPHGLDGDVATAIIDLYAEAGSPDDGTVRTTAYQILRRAGLDTSGRYYQSLLQTLFRLRTTTYTASEAWRDHGRGHWTTATFNYLSELEFTSDDEATELSSGSVLKIRLAEPIVRSIRARYTKPLDLDFLTSLERPQTRAVYRLLDARRYDPVTPGTLQPTLSVNIIEWAEACKIVDRRSNKIRATLQGAHEELMLRGYLEDVTFEGRGRAQTITYRFVALDTQPASPLVEAMRTYRVSLPVAQKLLTDFGEAHVRARLQRFEALISSGYKARNRSALLVDVVRDDQGKYADVPQVAPPQRQAPAPASYMPTLDEVASEDGNLEERVEATMKTVQFLLRERLSVSEYALLRLALILGRLDHARVTREATRAKREGQLDDFVTGLLDALQHVQLEAS
nr:plasmid replication initiator protein [Deinococcus sp. RM]